MEQHAVPRNISSFQFHLIGDMTLRQFGYLAGGAITAFIIYKASPLPTIVTMGIAGLFGLVGFAFAFVPIQERPLDMWMAAFIKSILSPTQYVWHKVPLLPDVLTRPIVVHIQQVPQNQKDAHVDARNKLDTYLHTLPAAPHQTLNLREKKYIDNTLTLFGKTPVASPQPASSAPSAPPPTPHPTVVPPSLSPLPQTPIMPPPPQQQPTGAQQYSSPTPIVATTPLSHPPIAAAPISVPPLQPITPFQKTPAVTPAPSAPTTPITTVPHTAMPATPTPIIPAQPIPAPVMPAPPVASAPPIPTPIQSGPTPIIPFPASGTPQPPPVVPTPIIPSPTAPPITPPQPAAVPLHTPVIPVAAAPVPQVPPLPPAPAVPIPSIPHSAPAAPVVSTPVTPAQPVATPTPVPPIAAPVVAPTPAAAGQANPEIDEMKRQLAQLMEEKKKLSQELTSMKQPPAPSAQEGPQVVKPIVAKDEPRKPTIKSVTPKQAVDEIGLPSLPQTPNVVIGVIKDGQKKQLPNIILTIKDSKGMPIRALKTNKLGQFITATPLANGTYYLEVEDPMKRYVFDVAEITMKGEIFLPIEITAKGEKDLIREKLNKELFGNT